MLNKNVNMLNQKLIILIIPIKKKLKENNMNLFI